MDHAERGIERCKELIGRVDAGSCKEIEERGLPRIGVAHKRDNRNAPLLPGLAALSPRSPDVLQLPADALDLLVDLAAVKLNLLRPVLL